MAAEESALEAKQTDFEERKERFQSLWRAREDAMEGKRMELELVWREKEMNFDDQRRNLESFECMMASRERRKRFVQTVAIRYFE